MIFLMNSVSKVHSGINSPPQKGTNGILYFIRKPLIRKERATALTFSLHVRGRFFGNREPTLFTANHGNDGFQL